MILVTGQNSDYMDKVFMSSIVNEAIMTNSNFFKKNFLQHKKHKTSKN